MGVESPNWLETRIILKNELHKWFRVYFEAGGRQWREPERQPTMTMAQAITGITSANVFLNPSESFRQTPFTGCIEDLGMWSAADYQYESTATNFRKNPRRGNVH
ncbi:hypothetical protein B0H11DRAFT_1907554 [Mycena galericulata]|nr:hypothetical protein B0H11DRAFT_1907554 [Mycena galericulata]